MASLDDLKPSYRLFMRAYPFRRYAAASVPCHPLRRSLAEARVALVTTAGLHLASDPPFDAGIKGGDTSWRAIPTTADVAALVESQRSDAFDHRGLAADRNLAFPLDRLRELVAEGAVGSLNHRHVSVMGSIAMPRGLVADSAPAIAAALSADGVDAVLLVPV